MTVIHAEERASRPCFVLSVLWLDDVQDDGHTVLVVVSYQALISVGSVGPDDTVPFVAALRWLVIRDDNPGAWRQWQSCCFLLLLVDHRVGVDHSE